MLWQRKRDAPPRMQQLYEFGVKSATLPADKPSIGGKFRQRIKQPEAGKPAQGW